MIMEEFVAWESGIKKEIEHVSMLLSEKLSDAPEQLIADLEAVEVWNDRCQSLLAQANSWLDRAKWNLMSKGEGLTVFDKETKLDNDVAPIRLVRDTLEGFCNSIKQRLILGEAILGYMRLFADYKVKAPAPLQKAVNDLPF